MKKFFSKNPLIWFHYLLLVGILYGAYYLGDWIFGSFFQTWWLMIIWFYLFISLGDQGIHFVLGVD